MAELESKAVQISPAGIVLIESGGLAHSRVCQGLDAMQVDGNTARCAACGWEGARGGLRGRDG